LDFRPLRDNNDGLNSFFKKECKLDDLIQDTDIPTLKLIAETPGLAILERSLSSAVRREYWLKDNIIDPLRQKFDLIILDCSPNWNHLISNAIVGCDLLISPIECKINQFRNLDVFRAMIEDFNKSMKLKYEHVYVPTKFKSTTKLSNDIRQWYTKEIPNVTLSVMRESGKVEEAMASQISVPEYIPSDLIADEMRELVKHIWSYVSSCSKKPAQTKNKNKAQETVAAA